MDDRLVIASVEAESLHELADVLEDCRHRPGKEYAEVGKLVFSTDGSKVAYIATTIKEQKKCVALNGVEQAKHDDIIGTPVFSPDGKHFVWFAKMGEKWQIRVDGAVKDVDVGNILSGPVWDSPTRFHFLALTFPRMERIEVEITASGQD